jgi:hypothetical protein
MPKAAVMANVFLAVGTTALLLAAAATIMTLETADEGACTLAFLCFMLGLAIAVVAFLRGDYSAEAKPSVMNRIAPQSLEMIARTSAKRPLGSHVDGWRNVILRSDIAGPQLGSYSLSALLMIAMVATWPTAVLLDISWSAALVSLLQLGALLISAVLVLSAWFALGALAAEFPLRAIPSFVKLCWRHHVRLAVSSLLNSGELDA